MGQINCVRVIEFLLVEALARAASGPAANGPSSSTPPPLKAPQLGRHCSLALQCLLAYREEAPGCLWKI